MRYGRNVRVVFVENHDSFSFNVLDLLPFERREVHVVEGNTERTSAALEGADLLIIGPGPMDPQRVGLIRLVQLAANQSLSTLGICLGIRPLAWRSGGAGSINSDTRQKSHSALSPQRPIR